MRLAHLVLGGLLIFWTAAAPAAPHITGAKPEPFVVKPGKHLQQRLAEKYGNTYKGYINPSLYSPTYTINVLFLLVEFKQETPDDPSTTGNGLWSDPTYANPTSITSGDPNYWVTKNATAFKNYYSEVSYGKLIVNVTVSTTVYPLPNTMASYDDKTGAGIENLICDSVKAADPDPAINFNAYEAIVIVHAGAGEETDVNNDTLGDFWSLYYNKGAAITGTNCSTGLSADGKTITDAVIMPQTGVQDAKTVDPLGVYVHEFGHWLGLPDLYPTGVFPWDGIGQWGIMGGGAYLGTPAGSSPAHPEAWSKVYLGWVTPTVLSSASDPAGQTLTAIQNIPPQVIKIPASTTTASQYFLLENRQKIGYDGGLPGDGLLVWYIDDAIVATKLPYNQVNANPARPGVSLREADGNNSLLTWEAGCSTLGAIPACDDGSPGDPFPGTSVTTSITPATTPNTKPPTGSGWVNIKSISPSGPTMTFDVGFGPPPPASVNVAISGSSAAMSWTPTTASDIATYHVYQNGAKIAETTGTTYSLSGSASDSYQVLGVDTNLNVGDLSAAASITVSSGSGGGGGGGCFIATAAFGSYEAPAVQLLRDFRDEYLLTNAAGKRFVEFYYSTSPPIAATIADSEALKALVRFLLLPWIALAWFFVQAGSVAEVVVVIMAVGVAFVLALPPKRNTSRGSL